MPEFSICATNLNSFIGLPKVGIHKKIIPNDMIRFIKWGLEAN